MKTKTILGVIDRDNHRSEEIDLVDIYIDDNRKLNDVIKNYYTDHELLIQMKEALNNAIEDVHTLASKLKLILVLLKTMLTDEEYNKIISLLQEEKK